MKKLVLIDGNNILNRAFYGIMGSKMLMTNDGKYTNAVYGFLSILFKIKEEIKPEYLAVTFDLKAPTARHKLYKEYKANRKGMPNELAEQMPIIKEVLKAMNIQIAEMEGYEADDLMGTLSRFGEKNGLEVIIVSGDRDTFQLATDLTTIKIPRTKIGKTEIEDFTKNKVLETYGVEPVQMIEVKALQGDASDNIPGVPGIGEKTALSIIQKYKTIDNLYQLIEAGKDDLKGKQREKIVENKDLAYLSKELGTINLEVPIKYSLDDLEVKEWNKEEVLKIFKELNFNKFIERFHLNEEVSSKSNDSLDELYSINTTKKIADIFDTIKKQKKIIYYFETIDDLDENKIIKKTITAINIYNKDENEVCYLKLNNEQSIEFLKNVFEDENIEKIGHNLTCDYILLKQLGIKPNNLSFDAQIAAYILNPTIGNYSIENLAKEYIKLDVEQYWVKCENKQMNLFEEEKEEKDLDKTIYVFIIAKLENAMIEKLKEINAYDLFKQIDMPTVEVLSDMQWNGMFVDIKELEKYGNDIKEKLSILTQEVYDLAGEEFNINSPKQLGEILFERLKLPIIKKTKSGYSTDVDVLEKLKPEHEIIEKILDYRQVMKLNSTYVEGLKPYINKKTKRIHSFFHQTITATGRISSTEPNLQNIPTRIELGKQLRKVFKPDNDRVYIDADYSQIELRVLAHMANIDEMINAFKKGEDIHREVASKVFNVPVDEVTPEQRSSAKAVNFGIIYGISDFGLGNQLNISRKKAKQYIDQYFEKYPGMKEYMDNTIEKAKELGYVETLYHRRRYIQELQSNNYMVRQFGARAAMNTPIQGTAADIMKIAMIKVYNELKNNNMKSKIVLQVHDEMMIEAVQDEKEKVKQILKNSMESACSLKVPLIAQISEAHDWYDAH